MREGKNVRRMVGKEQQEASGWLTDDDKGNLIYMMAAWGGVIANGIITLLKYTIGILVSHG